MRLRYTTMSEWPRLAWLAVCAASSRDVECYVGSGVEITADFFCEGTWCGEYEEGRFSETDLFFGSGARLEGDGVVFVGSCATVDKLLALRGPGFAMISNSLPCLLSCAGGRLDLGCLRYEQIFASVCKGLRNCERSLPTTVGDLQLSYFEDLRWDGSALSPREKEHVSRDFGSYASYRAFLDEAMAALAENARSSARRDPLRVLSTLSAGYDSAMTTVLGKQVGCNEAVGFDQARSGEDDSGQPIADALGVRFHALDSLAWRAAPTVVTSFLAGGAGNGADVIFHGAGSLLRGTVLLTGFHGDKMWDRRTTHLEPDIVRGDASGSDLSEYRLEAGFVNCPVPFWGVRQIKDVVRLSNALELGPWDVGRPYSRPICRRIVEEAGVPREMFGVRKRAACIDLLSDLTSPGNASDFLTRDSRGDYFQWLREQRTSDDRPHHTEVPWPGFFDYRSPPGRAVNAVLGRSAAQRLGPRSRAALGAVTLETGADRNLEQRRKLRHFIFHWATDRAIARYPRPEISAAIR